MRIAGRLLSLMLGLLTVSTAFAQSIWEGLDLPRCPSYQEVYADAPNDRVYYYGIRGMWPCDTYTSDVVARENGIWDSITALPGTMKSVVVYHDTLIMGGGFLTQPETNIQCYVNGALQAYGDFNEGIMGLRVLGDTLYAVGGFSMVDGQPAKGVAKRVGTHWVPVGTMPDDQPLVGDIIKYQGDLIIVGPCYSDNGRGIYHLVNNVWEVMGGGFTDLISMAGTLTEYQGQLYIGGQISRGLGNAGHGLLMWDGISYHDVGGGLLAYANDYNTLSSVGSLEVRDGLLYCGGGFNYAGDLESHGIAAWDGTRWCSVNGNLNATGLDNVNSMAFLGDSLYVGCGPTIDNVEVGFAACAPVSELLGDCQETAVPESGNLLGEIAAQPNPTNGLLQVAAKGLHPRAWWLTDALGREVMSGSERTDRFVIDVGDLRSGVYHLTVQGMDGLQCIRPVVRE